MVLRCSLQKELLNKLINIVLVEPEIPFNTGAIIRSCALTNSVLHLIEPLGFKLDEKSVKRAGLDYIELADVKVHSSLDSILSQKEGRCFFATTKTDQSYTVVSFNDGDYIVFGKESQGLSDEILGIDPKSHIKIPIVSTSKRSLNLSNAVNIIMYEALKQQGFIGME